MPQLGLIFFSSYRMMSPSSSTLLSSRAVLPLLSRALPRLHTFLRRGFRSAPLLFPAWSYSGETGPSHWGGQCSQGKQQCPVNLEVESSHLHLHRKGPPLISLQLPSPSSPYHLKNTGRTAGLRGMEGTLSFFHPVKGGEEEDILGAPSRFQLVDVHFHSPSENRVDGEAFDMEMHMVHRSSSNEIAVVAVLFEEKAQCTSPPLIDSILSRLPGSVEEEVEIPPLPLSSLLPSSPSVFHWKGSFTTPPCSEEVEWFLFKAPLPLQEGASEKFRAVFGFNARPVQPLNGREVELWEEMEGEGRGKKGWKGEEEG